MSEHLHSPKSSEKEHLDTSEQSKRNLELLQKAAKAEQDPKENIEKLQAEVNKEAVSAPEVTVGERQEDNATTPMGVHRKLKNDAYKQTMKRVQSRLHGPKKLMSRAIHQPVIEKISNVGAQTVARPSGILGGGFLALIGSTLLLFMAKRYGFPYNRSVFFLLFLGGFVIGLILEGLLKVLRKRTAH